MKEKLRDLKIGATVYITQGKRIHTNTVKYLEDDGEFFRIAIDEHHYEYRAKDKEATCVQQNHHSDIWLATTSEEASELVEQNRIEVVEELKGDFRKIWKEALRWDLFTTGHMSKDLRNWIEELELED